MTEWRCERFAELDRLIALEEGETKPRVLRTLDDHAISGDTEGVSMPEAPGDSPQVKCACVRWERHKSTIDAVISAVAEHFELEPAQITAKTNKPEFVRPRMIAMYLVRRLTGVSPREIGMAFGGKHHTTVRYAIGQIKRRVWTDDELLDTIQALDLAARIRTYVSRQ